MKISQLKSKSGFFLSRSHIGWDSGFSSKIGIILMKLGWLDSLTAYTHSFIWKTCQRCCQFHLDTFVEQICALLTPSTTCKASVNLLTNQIATLLLTEKKSTWHEKFPESQTWTFGQMQSPPSIRLKIWLKNLQWCHAHTLVINSSCEGTQPKFGGAARTLKPWPVYDKKFIRILENWCVIFRSCL